jgi:hypothetical protein
MGVEFANMIAERGIPKTGTAYEVRRYVHQPGGKGTRIVRETRYREYWNDVEIRFVGLFDAVGSFGVPGNGINLGKERCLPFNIRIRKAVHLVSEDERRSLFPPTDVTPGAPSLVVDFQQVSGKGDHSDFGGGHGGNDLDDPERGLSNYYLNWMVEQANTIPDQPLLFSPANAPFDVSMPVHDLTTDSGYRFLHNHRRVLPDGTVSITP